MPSVQSEVFPYRRFWVAVMATLLLTGGFSVGRAQEGVAMRMATTPALSPDGSRLAFSWRGDLWLSSSEGGVAQRLTDAPGLDDQPCFSPDGQQLAFVSERTGSRQVFIMPVAGGAARQITFHTEGCRLEQWTSTGKLLITAQRDHFWRHAERLFWIEPTPRPFENLLFDAAAEQGRFSPDENLVLFTREGTQWWRKGYRGSQAAQLWLFNRTDKSFTRLGEENVAAHSPLWHPDGQSFFYISERDGSFDLFRQNLQTGATTQVTQFADDIVQQPALAADGSRVVFRHLFDFYTANLAVGEAPRKIELRTGSDFYAPSETLATLSTASEVTFTEDGLEIAFIAGGDVWVMDTELREPVQITFTAERETNPVFTPDGQTLLYVSERGGQSDVWSVTRDNPEKYWWQNQTFVEKRLTEDSDVESQLTHAPAGSTVAFVKGGGDLWLMEANGNNPRKLLSSWSLESYDWSPDGQWLTYARQDDDFNSDVWVIPCDGSRPPVNLSMHPDNDGQPRWSPDGKVIAFNGRRFGEENDLFFVYLTASEDQISSRDRKLREALEKMQKGRSENKGGGKSSEAVPSAAEKPANVPPTAATPPTGSAPAATPGNPPTTGDKPAEPTAADGKKPADKPAGPSPVVIDFDGIDQRIRQVSVPNSTELNLFWSPDSKQLAFTAIVDGKRGLYAVKVPEDLKPTLLTNTLVSDARWLKKGEQIVGLASGVPTSLTNNGAKSTAYSFSAKHRYVNSEKHAHVFDLCWREMRDTFYDGHLNNKNWSEIRRKYRPQAEQAADLNALAEIVNLMLGELNGSHLGFRLTADPQGAPVAPWRDTTAHFGLRFDPEHPGPGLRVRDVIDGSPAWQSRSRIEAGETVLAINGTEVDPRLELTSVLTGPLDREFRLKVQNAAGEVRTVELRPISFATARGLMYDHWIRLNQEAVARLSDGKFGYMHIQGMNQGSFYRFERELYSVGNGKDGLVIDVRENGGGSTADHLLTILTQPVHAITVPRGGGPGYPHDRKIYATWNKPIVVLCNQNSFSNAEIFSHAIKTLKRGQVVGVPTAGGVISTGGTNILDVGFLRKPFRGWYLVQDGQDMELNGAVPHHVIWPQPTELPAGIDRQLEKAVEVLTQDVAAARAQPQPPLIPASQRK